MNIYRVSLAAVALFTFLTVAIVTIVGSRSEASAPPVAPEISVARPVIQTIASSERYPAVVEAVDRAVLHAQVSGYLDSITFEEGARVRQGDVLFNIDNRIYRAKLADAEAALAMAHAEAELARTESERALRLLKKNAISAEEAERRAAQATVARARVRAAEAAVNTARLNVEFSQVRAPFDGRIGRAQVTPGNLVTPADELAVIVATDRLYVRFDMNESEFVSFNPQAANSWSVSFFVDDRIVASGPVAIIDNEVRSGTGTVRIRARIGNSDQQLVPGMFGHADVVFGEQRDALLIDDKAIGTSQGRRYVLVVNKENALEFRPIVTGDVHDGMRHVKSGLTAGDRIVVDGLMRVRPGAVVTPVEISMTRVAGTLLPSRIHADS